MIGGVVIEVAEIMGEPDILYVEVASREYPTGPTETKAIYVELTGLSRKIEFGDALWWQAGNVMWTPARPSKRRKSQVRGKCGVDYDIQIKRASFASATHPFRQER